MIHTDGTRTIANAGPIVDRLPFQVYDPSTDLFIASATTQVAAEGAILDLLRCGYVQLQLFKATGDDTEELLKTARYVSWAADHAEWEVHDVPA